MTPEPKPESDYIETLEARKLQLETEKLIQERDKLAVETKLLRRPWFLQAPYIGAILPIVAISITAYVTYMNSDLKRDADNSKRELAAARSEKAKVEDQISAMKSRLEEWSAIVSQVPAARSELTEMRDKLAPTDSNVTASLDAKIAALLPFGK